MSFTTQNDVERRVQAARLEQAKRATVASVYHKFPLIVQCEASGRAILDIIKMFVGSDGSDSILPTYELFMSALDENPQAMESLAVRGEAATRQQLTEDIIAILRNKGKGHDEHSLRNEARRLAMLPIPELRLRLSTLQANAKMASTPITMLRQMVAESQPSSGYPALPTEIWDSAAGKFVRIDAAYIKAAHPAEIRRLGRIYSVATVNQRLNER